MDNARVKPEQHPRRTSGLERLGPEGNRAAKNQIGDAGLVLADERQGVSAASVGRRTGDEEKLAKPTCHGSDDSIEAILFASIGTAGDVPVLVAE